MQVIVKECNKLCPLWLALLTRRSSIFFKKKSQPIKLYIRTEAGTYCREHASHSWCIQAPQTACTNKSLNGGNVPSLPWDVPCTTSRHLLPTQKFYVHFSSTATVYLENIYSPHVLVLVAKSSIILCAIFYMQNGSHRGGCSKPYFSSAGICLQHGSRN